MTKLEAPETPPPGTDARCTQLFGGGGGDSVAPPPPPNSWVQRASVPGGGVSGASSFVIDGRIYIANGFRNGWTNVVYRYDPSQDSWQQLSSTPTSVRANAIGFAIGGYGYMGLGS